MDAFDPTGNSLLRTGSESAGEEIPAKKSHNFFSISLCIENVKKNNNSFQVCFCCLHLAHVVVFALPLAPAHPLDFRPHFFF